MRTPLRPPIGFAHRGARLERRENTIEAFTRALELGATGLESDAWLTRDDVVVLDHDGVVGLPLRRRRIRDHAHSTLPTHIPALADLYETLGSSFELSLDVKDPDAFGPILEVTAKAGSAARVWLCDDNLERIIERADHAGTAHMVLSTHLADLERAVPGGFGEAVARLATAGVAAVNLHGSEWNSDRVEAVHRGGLVAFGWDAQSEYHIARLVKLGVDGIYSDHVGLLMAVISEATPRT